MATYAALLSLNFTIKQIQQHPHPPICLHQQLLHSLTAILSFLQNFLEAYSKEDDELERRIAGAAYAVEDIIESHIVDQIHAGSTSHGENISCIGFYQDLEKVIQDMDSIKKEVMKIVEDQKNIGPHCSTNSSVSIGPVKPISRMQNNIMVDFGGIFNEVLYKLTGQQYNLQIIPIVGMGGIGKTTLARNIYVNPLIVQHFDILAWVTISQEYSRREVLRVLCREIQGINDLSQMSDDEQGERVYKNLWGRRYLIVMDDIWSIEAWNKVKTFFPNNNNGSRIMITTRQSHLTFQLSGSHDFQMNFLDEDKSWSLLCKIVFGEEICPIELENIGKKIVRNYRGLPLSIVVIGGLLTKSDMTADYWEYTLENLNSLINLENNGHCLQILRTSYKELPIHLKPCFLYMGVFQEDDQIHVSELIKLWVAEGFLKPIDGKSLEEVAKEYVSELIHRNLIAVHKLGSNGNVKSCKIHDLLRDLCLREAQKQRFLYVLRSNDLNIPQDINIQRGICIHENTEEEDSPQFLRAMESTSLTRSLLLIIKAFRESSPPFSFRLLSVYSRVDEYGRVLTNLSSIEAIFQHANLRYISIQFYLPQLCTFPSSWSLLWNLQTLRVDITFSFNLIIAPSEIWKMPLLRHVMINALEFELPDPPCMEVDIVWKT